MWSAIGVGVAVGVVPGELFPGELFAGELFAERLDEGSPPEGPSDADAPIVGDAVAGSAIDVSPLCWAAVDG